jgi:hypothetical protein
MRPSFIARFYNIYTPMLGRWAITYNYKVQNFKIDNANMDHCGCCELKHESLPHNDNDDDLWPYCI